MRIASLLASGTELVCALGHGASLVARSHECDSPPWVTGLPALSSATFDVSGASGEIDRLVNEKLRAGEPLYVIDGQLLAELAPDIVLTQVHCNVCAVSSSQLDPTHGWPALRGFKTVSMRGGSLKGILDDFTRVASELGKLGSRTRRTGGRVQLARYGGTRVPPVGRLTVTSPEGKEDHRKSQSLPFPESLCHRCNGCRTVVAKRSKFLMCTVLPTKYPRQPVLRCPSFVRRD